jgi:hypothetical protein
MPNLSTAAGARSWYAITVTNPGARTPGVDGMYTQTPIAIVPSPLIGSVRDATPRDLERFVAGTVVSTASRLVVLPFHPGITTRSVLAWKDRHGRTHTANVTGISNPDGREIDLVILAAEIVP